MRRIIAFYIDHMLVSLVLVSGSMAIFINSDLGISAGVMPLVIIIGMCIWFGYFIGADFFFKGMTLGKKALGLHVVWMTEEGRPKLSQAVAHILLKWLLAVFWPVGLIIYLVSGCKMPYDQRLGLFYAKPDPSKRLPGWKIAVRISAAVIAFIALIICIVSLLTSQLSNAAYYALKDDRVASVYTVLGKQKMVSYSFSGDADTVDKTYLYETKEQGRELAGQYMEYLILNEGFHENGTDTPNSSNPAVLKKITEDGRYEISVSVKYTENQLSVTLNRRLLQ